MSGYLSSERIRLLERERRWKDSQGSGPKCVMSVRWKAAIAFSSDSHLMFLPPPNPQTSDKVRGAVNRSRTLGGQGVGAERFRKVRYPLFPHSTGDVIFAFLTQSHHVP